MEKKSKKQRRAIQFTRLKSCSPEKYPSPQNSSSIIPVNDQSRQQSSMAYLTLQVNNVEVNLLKVKSAEKMTFEDDQQELENNEQDCQAEGQNGQNISRKVEEVYEQQQNDRKYIKETTSTYNQSVSQMKKQKQQEEQMRRAFSQKVKTEHYQYDESQNSSEQYQSQQEEIKQNANNQKIVQISKTFIASSFDDLIFGQIPQKCTIACAINFSHDFLSMSRSYDLYLVSDKKYLFSATKQRLKLTSQFKFIRNGKTKGQQTQFGELKSNFTGLEYVVNKFNRNNQNRVSEQCWIGFDLNLLGLSHQRNFTVLKNLNVKLEKIPYFSQIKNYYENGITSKFQKFTNRQATLNKFGDYQIDFHGKVNIPSSTNFILTNQKDEESIIFGKRNKNTHFLQIGYPFSIFEGFAIAISNLDHKLCVR